MEVKMKRNLMVLAILLLCVGCVQFTEAERSALAEMEAAGVQLETLHSVVPAICLGPLLGANRLYNGQVGLFARDFLFWPASMLWGWGGGAIDAGRINAKLNAQKWMRRKRRQGQGSR